MYYALVQLLAPNPTITVPLHKPSKPRFYCFISLQWCLHAPDIVQVVPSRKVKTPTVGIMQSFVDRMVHSGFSGQSIDQFDHNSIQHINTVHALISMNIYFATPFGYKCRLLVNCLER
jgi:hypothetical protein